jgi:two-component system CheB/CheR fusion protein
VSGFFRDPDAFRALAALVPSLFAQKGPDDAVRVWVVGCATGEEAYSIAMLLAEHAATLATPPRVQIFATDIDETGYARARDALYSAAAATGLPAERLSRFFVREAGGYRVRESLREGVLFAVHDVLRDTPFPRLDLVSCRSLLIHLRGEARERVVRTFHAALRPGGVLFLGATDSVGDARRFVPAQRIYLRRGTAARAPRPLP